MCKLLVTMVSNFSDRPVIMAQWVKVSDTKPKFDPQDPHGGREEWTPTNCPLTYEALIPSLLPTTTTTTNSVKFKKSKILTQPLARTLCCPLHLCSVSLS